MMRRAIHWAIFFLLLSTVPALHATAVEDVLRGMEKAGNTLKTFSADFVRERVFLIAEEKNSDNGKFFFEKAGKMVWEFQTPTVRTVLIESNRVSTYQPSIKQLQRIKLDEQKMGEFQMIGFGGSSKSLTDKYIVKLLGEDAAAFHLELTPRSIDSSLFTKIELWINRTALVPSGIKFYEKTTDETTIRFTGLQINPVLPTSRFKISVPPGTTIIE